MALRRSGLSQRRKAVGLTQESLAGRLGVERSTIVRWEAGDTEPLPSIRPSLARALQVSLDQLTELLTTSENPGTTNPDATPTHTSSTCSPASLLTPHGCDDRGLPTDADITHPADTDTDTAAAGGPPSPTAIPLDVKPVDIRWRRAWPPRFTRFAVAGVLAFAGGAASVLLMSHHSVMTSHSDLIPPAAAGIPAPDLGGSNDTRGDAVRTTPGVAPGQPANGPAPSEAAAVPAAPPANAASDNRATTRSRAATRTPAPPRGPAIPAQAYEEWSRAAGLSASDQRGAPFHPEFPAWP